VGYKKEEISKDVVIVMTDRQNALMDLVVAKSLNFYFFISSSLLSWKEQNVACIVSSTPCKSGEKSPKLAFLTLSAARARVDFNKDTTHWASERVSGSCMLASSVPALSEEEEEEEEGLCSFALLIRWRVYQAGDPVAAAAAR
jgi:hypothetical protein